MIELSEPERNEQREIIQNLLEANQKEEAQSRLAPLMDPDAADMICALDPAYQARALNLLPVERAAQVITYLPLELRENLWPQFSDEDLASILSEMEPDDRPTLLDTVVSERIPSLLSLIQPKERRETQAILSFPPESVGRLMTPHFIKIQAGWSLSDVLLHVRQQGAQAESLETLYVVDEEGRLIDDIELREVLLADPEKFVRELMDNQYIALNANADQEEAVRTMERYDRPILPVVNENEKLLGVVTFDDIADIAEAEVSEDIEKLGGMEALGDRYSSISLLKLFRKRVSWLVALFGGGILTVVAMGSFQEKIEQQAILALFVPLIIASGGNTGTQTASLMIRALALGDLGLGDWFKVMRREIASGVLLGLVLGFMGFITAFVAAALFAGAGAGEAGPSSWQMGTAIGTAIASVVICGTLVGSMLPFFFGRLGVDPATSSTPTVTTILDVTGLVLYFLIASLVIGL